MVIWLTGLPCSGKTTIAKELEKNLLAETLDGDDLRGSVFSQGIGFSKEEREQHLLRTGYLAERLSKYVDVICSFVSPFEDIREKLPIDFLIYVKCPVEVCEERDVKGMYAKARKGEIKGFTGLDAPYEEPIAPDIIVETNDNSLEECVSAILEKLPNCTRKTPCCCGRKNTIL